MEPGIAIVKGNKVEQLEKPPKPPKPPKPKEKLELEDHCVCTSKLLAANCEIDELHVEKIHAKQLTDILDEISKLNERISKIESAIQTINLL